jgi:acetyltransferase-like isoleucine patch superfamily enzyme
MSAGQMKTSWSGYLNLMRIAALSCCWRVEARLRGLELGEAVRFNGRPYLYRALNSRIVIGDAACLNSALRSNPIGCSRPVSLRTLQSGAEIILGDGVGLSGTSICAAASVVIGEGTFVGADTLIFDNDFHAPAGEWGWGPAAPDNPKAVKIGRGVFIGARCIILKGVQIGDRAVIGAGAVVTRDVPAGHVAVGNPAKSFARNGGGKPARVQD